MASTTSPEASEIRRRGRRRLIGAIALVVLLVVFVPMLLDSEPRKSREGPSAAIPPKESVAPLPASAPAPAPPPEVAPPAAVPPAAVPPAAAGSAAAPAPATVTVAPTPGEGARGQAQAGTASEPKLEGFAVQVGAFRDEAKLRQARDRLAGLGVAHYTERLEGKSGPLTRLRAGPFKDRAQAEAALAKLRQSAIEGKVVPLQ